MVPHLVLIYTPKEAHSRIFVTGGSVIAWQMLAKKKYYSWGGQLVRCTSVEYNSRRTRGAELYRWQCQNGCRYSVRM